MGPAASRLPNFFGSHNSEVKTTMVTTHVADQPLAGQVEAAFRVGERNSFVIDANLATSTDAVKAAIDARAATKHVSDQPIANSVKSAVDKVDPFAGTGVVTGGSIAAIYSGIDGTWDENAPDGM